jgi:hypothetical protein
MTNDDDDRPQRELFQEGIIYAVSFFVSTTSEAVANQLFRLLHGRGFSVHISVDERWCGIGRMPWLLTVTTTGVPLPADETPRRAWGLVQKAIDSIPRGTGIASTKPVATIGEWDFRPVAPVATVDSETESMYGMPPLRSGRGW